MLGDAWTVSNLVWPSQVGTPLGHRALLRHLHGACAHAGIRRVSFHTMRHFDLPERADTETATRDPPGPDRRHGSLHEGRQVRDRHPTRRTNPDPRQNPRPQQLVQLRPRHPRCAAAGIVSSGTSPLSLTWRHAAGSPALIDNTPVSRAADVPRVTRSGRPTTTRDSWRHGPQLCWWPSMALQSSECPPRVGPGRPRPLTISIGHAGGPAPTGRTAGRSGYCRARAAAEPRRSSTAGNRCQRHRQMKP